ncbi:MAG: hypothetical protein R6W31_00910 [Bacteroidales bacterium]
MKKNLSFRSSEPSHLIVPERPFCNGSIMVVVVLGDVIEVDEIGLVGAKEIFAGQAIFNVFQNTVQEVLFS